MDTSELPAFVEFRCILFLDTSESDGFGASRCIRNLWFLEYTSEMPRLRAFPMYYCTSFSRRYIGIENSMPIPMYEGPIPSKKYIGMGQYRPFPMYRPKSPNIAKTKHIGIQQFHPIPMYFINFPRIYPLSLAVYPRASQPQLISREYTRSLSQYIPAQAGKT